jgi:glutamine synthetase
MYKPGKEVATRCEYRAPDPACNPYLAYAVMIAAGLKGIENKYPLAEPVEVDIYHLTEAERKRLKIQELPGSLAEAVAEVEKSALVKEALGEHIFNKFIENKKIEWDNFRTHVSTYEIDRYLPIL